MLGLETKSLFSAILYATSSQRRTDGHASGVAHHLLVDGQARAEKKFQKQKNESSPSCGAIQDFMFKDFDRVLLKIFVFKSSSLKCE